MDERDELDELFESLMGCQPGVEAATKIVRNQLETAKQLHKRREELGLSRDELIQRLGGSEEAEEIVDGIEYLEDTRPETLERYMGALSTRAIAATR